MPEEKKSEVTEEIKEARKLTEAELEKVTGGGSATLEVASEVAQAIFGAEQMDIDAIFMTEDKAEEATEYAKAQVYRQAAKAMLAQVNSKPADVFGLFQ